MKSAIETLFSRMEKGGNWSDFFKEIVQLHKQADSEEEYECLLENFAILFETGKLCHDAETWEKLIPICESQYHCFLVAEAWVNDNLDTYRYDWIIRREISAGRLEPSERSEELASKAAEIVTIMKGGEKLSRWKLPNLFWPVNTKANPSGVIRFGRVLHWFFTAIAICVASGIVISPFNANSMFEGLVMASLWAGASILPFFFGRALRYIFAGE